MVRVRGGSAAVTAASARDFLQLCSGGKETNEVSHPRATCKFRVDPSRCVSRHASNSARPGVLLARVYGLRPLPKWSRQGSGWSSLGAEIS